MQNKTKPIIVIITHVPMWLRMKRVYLSFLQCEHSWAAQGQEDPLEKEMATHSSILAWKIPWTERSLVDYSPWGCKESDTTE